MTSEDGVLSLPFRLAVSMMVIAIAVPLCMSSLEDGSTNMSRAVILEIAQEISDTISEVSFRPIGESRILKFDDRLGQLRPGMQIIVGDTFGGRNFSLISCEDGTGWRRTVQIHLSDCIDGVCSSLYLPAVFGGDSGDIVVSHRGSQFEDLVMLEAS